MNDRIDDAIAALPPAGPDFGSNVQIPILISSTGRPVILSIPADITEDELLELVTYMTLGNAQGLRAQLRSMRGPQIVIARGPLT